MNQLSSTIAETEFTKAQKAVFKALTVAIKAQTTAFARQFTELWAVVNSQIWLEQA